MARIVLKDAEKAFKHFFQAAAISPVFIYVRRRISANSKQGRVMKDRALGLSSPESPAAYLLGRSKFWIAAQWRLKSAANARLTFQRDHLECRPLIRRSCVPNYFRAVRLKWRRSLTLAEQDRVTKDELPGELSWLVNSICWRIRNSARAAHVVIVGAKKNRSRSAWARKHVRNGNALPGGVIFEEGNEYLQRSWHRGPHRLHTRVSSTANINRLI